MCLLTKYQSSTLDSPQRCEIPNFQGQIYCVAKMHAQDHTYSCMHMVHNPWRTLSAVLKGIHIARCDPLKRVDYHFSLLMEVFSFSICSVWIYSTSLYGPLYIFSCVHSITWASTAKGKEGGIFLESFPLGEKRTSFLDWTFCSLLA